MNIPLHVIDAFVTDTPFSGNPAAVCPLPHWLRESLMQAIAEENKHSETAFFIPDEESGPGAYHLRWFTPAAEVDLCGHATLASAAVVFAENPGLDRVRFTSRSGPLAVSRDSESSLLRMDFPTLPMARMPQVGPLGDWLGNVLQETYVGMDVMAVLDGAEAVRALEPDLGLIRRLGRRGLIVCAASDHEDCDIVTRYFAPAYGVDEDPVTGSIHCALVPYWAARLGKAIIRSRQLSRRGGFLRCELRGARVEIAGKTRVFSRGEIFP